jgi:hypothetical protein
MFAKRLMYVNHGEGQFVALLELLEMEDGVEKSRSFILYKYYVFCEIRKIEMIEVCSRKRAKKLFPFAAGLTWIETTPWLYAVATNRVSGESDWIEVGDRPKKKIVRLRFGNLIDIHLARKAEENFVEREIYLLPHLLVCDTTEAELDTSQLRITDFLAKKASLENELQERQAYSSMVWSEIAYVDSQMYLCG